MHHACMHAHYALQARVNVPAPSVRTLQRGIAASNFAVGPQLQVQSVYRAVAIVGLRKCSTDGSVARSSQSTP